MSVPTTDHTATPSATQLKALPSSHRLPTVSASQALLNLAPDGPEVISSGLPSLDKILTGDGNSGGFERGKVSEIWGPNGGGKTTIALESAADALKHGGKVLWVDTVTSLNGPRLQSSIPRLSSEPDTTKPQDRLQHFRHTTARTLSHLLALFLHPSFNFPPSETSLIIIRGIHPLIDLDYPRFTIANSKKTEQQKWQSNRRYGILGSLVTALNKLAVIHNLAIVVINGCASRQRTDVGLSAALVPGVGGTEWDAGIWNRMVVFRDFGGRFVGVQKCQGRSLISREEVGEVGRIVGFEILEDGSLHERGMDGSSGGDGVGQAAPQVVRSPVKTKKRLHDEIANSDGEDADEYGWAEIDDDTLAAESVGEEQGVADVTDVT